MLRLAFSLQPVAGAWRSQWRRLPSGALRWLVLGALVGASVPACGKNLVLDFDDAGTGGSGPAGAGGGLGAMGGSAGVAGMGGTAEGGAAGQGQGGTAGVGGSSGAGGGLGLTDAGAARDAGDAALDASN